MYICLYVYVIFFFWLCRTACGTLLPRPGIEPRAPAGEVQSPNHWATRELPMCNFIYTYCVYIHLYTSVCFIYTHIHIEKEKERI